MQPSPSRARRVLAFCLLSACFSFAPLAFAEPPEIVVTSYGAAEKVSGSLHALDIGDTRVIIDCGLEYAEKQRDDSESAPDEHPKQTALPIDAGKIDAVFLTHAHLDHVGRLPLLVASGYTGPIYCTDATKQLLAVVMDSQIYFDREVARDWYWSAISRSKAAENKKSFTVHWMPDCPFGGKIYAKNKRTFQGSRLELEDHFTQTEHEDRFRCCRECQKRNVDAILRMVKTVKVGETGELAPGVTFKFLPAGHLPGSVSVLFEATDGDQQCCLLFSGDLGSGLSPLRPSPPPAPPVDFVAVETTYGAKVRDPETKNGFARFRSVVGKAIADGHTVLIPAFSLDRTQTVLQQLHAAREEGLLAADAPVYCPSPTSRRYTEIYERNRTAGWFPQPVAESKGLWSADSFLSRGPDSKTLADTPLVYVTTNNLGTAGWSKKLLKDLLPPRRR